MVKTTLPDVPSTWPEVEAYMRRHYQLNVASCSTYRLGQAYFNALCEIYPEVAELVRGTMADPFYADRVHDERMVLFFDTIIPYFK